MLINCFCKNDMALLFEDDFVIRLTTLSLLLKIICFFHYRSLRCCYKIPVTPMLPRNIASLSKLEKNFVCKSNIPIQQEIYINLLAQIDLCLTTSLCFRMLVQNIYWNSYYSILNYNVSFKLDDSFLITFVVRFVMLCHKITTYFLKWTIQYRAFHKICHEKSQNNKNVCVVYSFMCRYCEYMHQWS